MATLKSSTRHQVVPGSKRARTRERLLDSAAELFQAKGIFSVSLDELAAHAGFTKGAIYGNFASKDDLVYAVTIERTSRAIPIFEGDAPIGEQLRRLIENAFSRAQNTRQYFGFLAELDSYALAHEALARRFVEYARECHEQSAKNLAELTKEQPLSLAPIEFAIVVTGLLNGLLFQHACFPDIVTREVIVETLCALV